MITTGVVIPSSVINVVVIISIVIDNATNGVLILFNEVSFSIDLESIQRFRIVDVLRKGVPKFWTKYLYHFCPIINQVSPLSKKIPCVLHVTNIKVLGTINIGC